MNPHYTYLLIDVLTALFPFLLSFDKKVAFYKQWKNLWVGLLLTGAVFIAWDVWFAAMGIWSFSDKYITGIMIAGLPIEEWAFFLVVPYSCVFIYECLLCYFPFRQKKDWGWNVMLWLGIITLAVGFMNSYRAYTFSAFSLCGFAMILLYVLRNRFPTFNAAAFVVCYIISLVPFLIVNGLLTSLPVVMYDDAENLSIRIYTIPFEDTVYGMLLMLGNVWGMEWMRGRRTKTA